MIGQKKEKIVIFLSSDTLRLSTILPQRTVAASMIIKLDDKPYGVIF